MSMCRAISCVVERKCLLWPVHSLDKTLLVFSLLRIVLQGQICLFLQVSLDFLLLHSSPLWWKKRIIFGVRGCLFYRIFIELFSFSFFGISGWGIIDLIYYNIEWLALELSRDHSVIFETALRYYKEIATHYSIFAWRIPMTEEHGGLQSIG